MHFACILEVHGLFHVLLICDNSNNQPTIATHNLLYMLDIKFCPTCWRSSAPAVIFHPITPLFTLSEAFQVLVTNFSLTKNFWFIRGIMFIFRSSQRKKSGNLLCAPCTSLGRCLWCNRYRRRKWTRRHEFKSWTRLNAFHIALIPLGKVWIILFSLQLWVNSRTD